MLAQDRVEGGARQLHEPIFIDRAQPGVLRHGLEGAAEREDVAVFVERAAHELADATVVVRRLDGRAIAFGHVPIMPYALVVRAAQSAGQNT